MLCAPWGGPGELIPAPMALGCVSPWSLPQQSGQAGPEHPSWLTEGPPVTGDGSWISAPSIRSSRGLLLGGEGMGDDESLPASSYLVHPHQDLKPVIDGMDGIKISQGLGLQDFDLIRVIGRGYSGAASTYQGRLAAENSSLCTEGGNYIRPLGSPSARAAHH